MAQAGANAGKCKEPFSVESHARKRRGEHETDLREAAQQHGQQTPHESHILLMSFLLLFCALKR